MTCVLEMDVDPADSTPAIDDFLSTGRTGRRNALPDILSENAAVSTAQLPDTLQKLSCSDTPPNGTVCTGASTSGQSSEASSSKT